ncbi:MAG: hypothetical protein Sylvanvirus18_14 [Sylvanvirus sp.]|uniref:Uncharacterized protein n=1 Tax=Sylvanvirus sp. TaxID=2487774 RepID=A0A3G5AK22_9VIRU|nr:MAG: hypothetical protein Sylvanvirus18_14 [Sylvanvirus sp.]
MNSLLLSSIDDRDSKDSKTPTLNQIESPEIDKDHPFSTNTNKSHDSSDYSDSPNPENESSIHSSPEAFQALQKLSPQGGFDCKASTRPGAGYGLFATKDLEAGHVVPKMLFPFVNDFLIFESTDFNKCKGNFEQLKHRWSLYVSASRANSSLPWLDDISRAQLLEECRLKKSLGIFGLSNGSLDSSRTLTKSVKKGQEIFRSYSSEWLTHIWRDFVIYVITNPRFIEEVKANKRPGPESTSTSADPKPKPSKKIKCMHLITLLNNVDGIRRTILELVPEDLQLIAIQTSYLLQYLFDADEELKKLKLPCGFPNEWYKAQQLWIKSSLLNGSAESNKSV